MSETHGRKRTAGYKIRSAYVDLLDTASIESCLLVKSLHPLSGTSSHWAVVCVPATFRYDSDFPLADVILPKGMMMVSDLSGM